MAPKSISSSLNHCHVTTTPSFPLTPSRTFFHLPTHKPTLHSLSSSSYLHLPRVTTVPINYLPPPQPPHTNFPLEISRLKSLLHSLSSVHSPSEKLAILNNDSRVREFCMKKLGEVLEEREMYLVKCVVAAGQGHVVESGWEEEEREMSGRSLLKSALYSIVEMIEGWEGNDRAGVREKEKEKGNEKEVKALRKLVKVLEDVERFYDCIGGIIG